MEAVPKNQQLLFGYTLSVIGGGKGEEEIIHTNIVLQ
jgi:hypothetical protein